MLVLRSSFGRGLAVSAAALGAYGITKARADGKGLDPKDFHPFEVIDIQPYNYNSKVYTVKVPNQGKLPVSSFVMTKAPGVVGKDGKEAIRPYTPITANVDGYVKLLIKSYPDGIMSKHWGSLKKGDKVELKGPLVKLEYKPNEKKEIVLLGGGSGLTPCLQVIEEVLSNKDDKTNVTFIFANQSEKDILLKERLDILQASHENFHVHYILDQASQSWRGLRGYVNKDVLARYLPSPKLNNDIRIYVCGPPGFMKAISGDKKHEGLLSRRINRSIKRIRIHRNSSL